MNYETKVPADGGDPVGEGYAEDARVEADAEDRRARRKKLIIIVGVVLALIALGLVIYRSMASDAVPEGDREAQLPVVTVIQPGRTTVEGTVTATGTLAARRDQPIGVVGEGGRVVSVSVDAGEWVREGQVLVVIDRSVQTQQVQAATAQIEVARADANLAQANLDRALQLVDRGFISKADVDRLTATRDGANARLRVAQAQRSELQARNARLNVVAPSSGLVLERNVEPGETVGPGSGPLFRIARGGEMEMLAQLGETELASLATGVAAEVQPVGSEKVFEGQVWQIAPTIDEQTRQGTARIALAYAPGLKPGGFATATIRSGTVVAPVLPESALLDDDGQSYVFIVDADNTVVRRDVETGEISDEGLTIIGGLSGGERIVLRSGGFLRAGEKVTPRLQKRGS